MPAARKKSSDQPNAIAALQLLTRPGRLPTGRLYVLHGSDPFLKRECWLIIRNRLLGEGDPGLQVSEFSGDGVEPRDVFDELNLLPFGGGRRIVLVDNADSFLSTYAQVLLRQLASPRYRGVLVLRTNGWDRRTKLVQHLEKTACVIDCNPPPPRSIAAWLPAWARERYQKKLQPNAVQMLMELVGAEPGRLDQELEKLSVYVGDQAEITAEDVDALVVAGRTRTVWELVNATASGDAATALRILDKLLLAGESAVGIHAAMALQFRRLARAARLILKGTPTPTALREAGVPAFAVQAGVAQLRHIGRVRLLRMYDLLLEADLQLKSSDVDQRQVLERLILTLAAPADAVSSQVLG